MIAIFIGLLKFLGVCFLAFVGFVCWACVHVGKMHEEEKEWWADDEWH